MPPTVLIVDDDAEFRDEFKEGLEDYQVFVAASGQEALEKLRQPNTIDVVLLDVMMPGQRGTQTLVEMRKIAPDVGIIMLTGFSSKDVAVAALQGKADDYLEKPVCVEKVREVIEKVLAAKHAYPEIYGDDIHAKIARVKEFATRNCLKKISLEDAAAVACLSPKYLSRIFKKDTGQGFSEFRLHLKLEKAKTMLENSTRTIGQISEELGYQNQETFWRLFKRLTGSTPREYRLAHQRSTISAR